MAKFKISAVKPGTKDTTIFWYDNMSSLIFTETGEIIDFGEPIEKKEYTPFPVTTSKATPAGKSREVKKLKIQLGLSCNYSCSYCNQRFVPKADETTQENVQPFLDKLPSWIQPGEAFEVQFWGGEPLVYWKTLKPLAEGIKQLYPGARLMMITNGSLLTPEINTWIDNMGLTIGLSHDGPGYHVRGLDPFDDPKQFANIMDLWNKLGPKSQMSFNVMIHKGNQSRLKVIEWFKERLGFIPPIGEGSFIDPYDEGGEASSINDLHDHVKYRINAITEIRSGNINSFDVVGRKIYGFVNAVLNKRPASALGQKCGMDDEHNLSVDLTGNVLTCQNVSSNAVSFNKESHNIGHLDDIGNVKLTTSTHWSHRDNCSKCPVLQLCQGSCMFLEGNMFKLACDNAYTDNIPFFMAAFEVLTGHVPYYIDGDFPDERKDITGTISGIPQPRKIIPIIAN